MLIILFAFQCHRTANALCWRVGISVSFASWKIQFQPLCLRTVDFLAPLALTGLRVALKLEHSNENTVSWTSRKRQNPGAFAVF